MTAPREEAAHIGDAPADETRRQYFVHILSQIPSLVTAARQLGTGDVFRAVMSEKNVHLFKEAADGTYKPFLREGGKFVENVDLVRVPPNYLETMSNFAFMANMAAVAAKLDAIQRAVGDIDRKIANTQRGRVEGTLDALALAGRLSDPAERRGQMLSACRDVVSETRALGGQLKSHIAAMPKATTGFFDGFFGSGIEEAVLAHAQVEQDVALLIQAVRALLLAYQELEEPAVGKEAVARILAAFRGVSLPDAIQKARLVPVSGHGILPEAVLESFRDVVTVMDTRLLSNDNAVQAVISLDIKAEELRG